MRNESSGEIVYKDNFSHSIAKILCADYNLDNRDEVVCCTVDGEGNCPLLYSLHIREI